MTRVFLVAILATCAAVSQAADRGILQRGTGGVWHGAEVGAAKALDATSALGDSLYLIGNPDDPGHYDQNGIGPQAIGTFEDAGGNPSWNGWTHEDATFSDESFWHVSDFNAVDGACSYWCGEYFDDGTDPGYGNEYLQLVVFTETVSDPTVASTVDWQAVLNHDSEPGWDFTYFEWNQGGVWNTVGTYDGTGVAVSFDASFTYQPADYVGANDDEIQLRIRCISDGNTSDQDGLYPSDGLCQVDVIAVTVAGTLVDFEDFEDQVADRWLPDFPPFVGDFAALYTDLQDEDPCLQNGSPQVAFIDDGVVVPGTGGTPGITWVYGPGGYIVNNTGGLAGDGYYLDNLIVSPVLIWPENGDDALLEAEIYLHEPLLPDSPGVLCRWFVRSVASGDPADLPDAPFEPLGLSIYGGPGYEMYRRRLGPDLEPGRTHVQVAMRVLHDGPTFGYDGHDGTPAPYLDNVRVVAYPAGGPLIESREINHYQDAFPASGVIDLSDLGSNHVPLDIAANKADLPTIDPGDSLVFQTRVIREGAVLNVPPRLHVQMRANPLFDPHRSLPDGLALTPDHFADGWSLVSGSVEADQCYINGTPLPEHWCVDLPDQWFFYPGDELRWCIEAQDRLAGDIGTSLLPADTTGFTDFSDSAQHYPHPSPYPHAFTVRGLPTVFSGDGYQPAILFWNDAGDDAMEWRTTFAELVLRRGGHYDLYETRAAADEDGNGLGGRAQAAQLAGYNVILYGSGALQTSLLGDGQGLDDASPDIPLLTDWFALEDKHLLVTSANAAEHLQQTPTGASFLNEYLGVAWLAEDIAPLIDGQTSPLVRGIPDAGVIAGEWVAHGGCPSLPGFDAINATASAVRIAEFTAGGQGGGYDYAAGVVNLVAAVNASTVYFPYDLEAIVNAPGHTSGLSMRSLLLYYILGFFDEGWVVIPASPEPAAVLSAQAYPNPFNPRTTIELSLPRTGEVSLKVYDLRGALVRTLVAGELSAGSHQVVWDGTSDAGRAVASGIYFYETRAGDAVSLGKLTLVK
jgi:hypothetical protein